MLDADTGAALLRVTLIVKIAVTLPVWAGPCLLASPALIEKVSGERPHPLFMVRLLGVAFLALVVAYGAGLVALNEGRVPWGVMLAGIVSNGGAAAVLLQHLMRRSPAGLATVLLWGSFTALSAIAASLLAAGLILWLAP